MLKSFYINTYGCQMNVHESEKIAGILYSRGFSRTDEISKADLIVYNTCCIRETAETRVYGHLGKAKKFKENNPGVKLVLCGCMPQKPGAAEVLKKKFPYVDLMLGTHNIALLGEYLDKLFMQKGRVYDIWESEREIPDAPVSRGGGLNAWVNIMYGCDNFCSYCIVPYVRGRERSRDFDTVIKEVDGLINTGYKEITLLGQNVNSYNGNGKNFAALLKEISNLNGKFRLKFMTSHPKDLSEEVVRIIAENRNMSKFIHLPVQAGSDRILKLMNRRYTHSDYLKKIAMIREFMPDAGLSTDIMTGFPTETEEEFLDTLRLVEEVRFDNIYSFIYNRRSGTAADTMDGQVPYDVKVERVERLIALYRSISTEIAAESAGKTYEVLCDSVKNGQGHGKTHNEKAVTFKSEIENVGKFVNIKITGAKNTGLTGLQI